MLKIWRNAPFRNNNAAARLVTTRWALSTAVIRSCLPAALGLRGHHVVLWGPRDNPALGLALWPRHHIVSSITPLPRPPHCFPIDTTVPATTLLPHWHHCPHHVASPLTPLPLPSCCFPTDTTAPTMLLPHWHHCPCYHIVSPMAPLPHTTTLPSDTIAQWGWSAVTRLRPLNNLRINLRQGAGKGRRAGKGKPSRRELLGSQCSQQLLLGAPMAAAISGACPSPTAACCCCGRYLGGAEHTVTLRPQN